MNSLDALLDKLWKQYIDINPRAHRIAQLLESEGETIANDHIAFRTFDLDRVRLQKLANCFTAHGYEYGGEYHFPQKKLYAHHYQHPDPSYPLVFISELLTQEFSPTLQNIVSGLIEQIPAGLEDTPDFCASGRPWNVSFKDYQVLQQESEYAAWLSAFGFRANHFTVYVNGLNKFPDLESLNHYLKDNGYVMNSSGGEIKGSPEQLLEQSSTMAETVRVDFTDGAFSIPSCYYEFARRYPQADGSIYRGFIAASANRIFESTDKK